MDYLESVMSAETHETTFPDEEESRLGRPRELKSILLEVNSLPGAEFRADEIEGVIRDTGVEHIKQLNLSANRDSAEFFVDMTDTRFWVLHTDARADVAHPLVERLVSSPSFQFDRAWIPTQVLKKISGLPGNAFGGFGLEYFDLFPESPEPSTEKMSMDFYGTSAERALRVLTADADLQRSSAYEKIRIRRGHSGAYAKDDLRYNGIITVKTGQSVDDHVSFVDDTKNLYREAVTSIEKFWLRSVSAGDYFRVEGQAFDIKLERQIPSLESFLEQLLNSSDPFRLWGVKSKVEGDYYRVMALDLHTGHPLDLEVGQGLIRVYLPDKSCGNSLLRLYVNLQHFFDSRTHFEGAVSLGA
jgi:hypothetical protein